MFFENENFLFNLLDVVYLDQDAVNSYNCGRNFNALSFRFRADTILSTEKQECRMGDNFVSYVPARLNYSRISTCEELIAIHFETTTYNTKQIEYFKAEPPQRIAALFRDIFECWSKKEVGYKLRCSAILYEIFAECYAQNYHSAVAASLIQPSVDYIEKNYLRGDVTVGEIAARSFVSEVYFRRLFKEQFGTSPQRYLIQRRIQYAAELISMGYYSLKDVAYMSGYTDYKYFSVEFKKYMGVSPSEYVYNFNGVGKKDREGK